MKKTIILLLLVALTLSANCQSLFKPVPHDLLKSDNKELKAGGIPSQWLFRLSAGVVAIQWTVENKQIVQNAFNKFGAGLSYAHFVEQEGLPYNDLSINGFVFFPTEGSKVTFALTVSTLKFFQVGLCYDLATKKPGLLTGISYTF